MLIRLTKAMRLRAAVILAVFYALCVVTPSLALAFADGPAAAHCLTDDHHGNKSKSLASVHDDAGAAPHSHSGQDASVADADDSSGKSGKCCGLFCTTALPAADFAPFGQSVHGSALALVVQDHLTGRGPDRLIRPPISPLSL